MTSTNDGKDVKSNQTSGPKGKSYYIELYKFLEARLSDGGDAHERTKHLCAAWRSVHSLCQHSAPSTHTHLLNWLQRHTARAVLQTEWQTPKRKDDRKSLEEGIDVFISQVVEASRDGGSLPWEAQLVARGEWFKRILDKPWDHPVLTLLLNPNGTPPTDDEVLAWLKEERGVTFVVRLHTLVGEKCEDIAVSLASAVMERARAARPPLPDSEEQTAGPVASASPTFADKLKGEAGFTLDVWEMLTDIEFVLLHKRDSNRCIALAKQTPLLDAYPLIERLQKRLEVSPREKRLWKNAREVAILIAQVVIARCMVVKCCAGAARTALYCCARLLARLLTSRLPAAADALAAQALTAKHLHTLAQAVDKQLSPTNEEMKPYVCELYVRAITAGMNELERFKLKTEKEAEARSMEKTLASWFVQLGIVLARSDRIACECTLTAFSLHPSQKMYERIDAAPPLAPVLADPNESKEEAVKSEFGSWANDSRSQTNLVKTSETLNMKHTQNLANVLSTAIFNEGEALGLSPELCQDIAVLLSGPRVKTLSWDMDRTLLLENCRAYSEVTHEGTRVLTRELKYLNIDPQQYQHLPEEKDDDENDPYYGIERGYEHLAVLEEPEEIWEDANDSDHTESASSIEKYYMAPRRKKKTKRAPHSSEEDSDPLSFMAEAKRTQKKKVRPHSKERSKEDKNKELVDPLDLNAPIQNESQTKPKKEPKVKKERKKKEKIPKVIGGKRSSHVNLVGLKVKPKKKSKAITTVITPVTDSDYDSQGKNSLTSQNSEGIDPDSICTESIPGAQRKVQETKSYSGMTKNQTRITYNMMGNKCSPLHVLERPPNNLTRMQYRPQTSNTVRQPSPSDFNKGMSYNHRNYPEDVRANLSRLLEFRRQRDMHLKLSQQNSIPQTPPRKPAIIRTDIPLHTNISPKSVTIPEIPKSFINKEQAEKLAELIREQKKADSKNSVIQYARKTDDDKKTAAPSSLHPRNKAQHSNAGSIKITDIVNPSYDRLMAEIAERHKRGQEVIKPTQSQYQPTYSKNPVQHSQRPVQRSLNVLTPGQRDFQKFLKEYEQNKCMVTQAIDMSSKSAREVKKPIMPINRVIPVVPNLPKPDPKPLNCPKQQAQKKPEPSLNTFSRLSYHKNKQNEMKNKIETPKLSTCETYQEVSSELDEIIKEHQRAQMKVIQAKREIDRSMKPVSAQEPADKYETVAMGHPLLSNLLQCTPSTPNLQFCRNETSFKNHTEEQTSPPPLKTSLSEKDNLDLLSLMWQQNKLNNSQYYSTNINSKSSTSTINKATPVTTCSPTSCPSQQQPTRPSTQGAKSFASTLETKIINVISNTLLKPGHHEINNSLSVNFKPQSNVSATKPINCTVTQDAVNKPVVSKDQFEKKYIPESSKAEWQAVMCDLLRHKTPTRGPNALDVALNKSSFESAFEKSLKEASTFSQSQPANEKDTVSKHQEKSDRPKPVIASIQNVIITKKGIKLKNEVLKKQKDPAGVSKVHSKQPVIATNEKSKGHNTSETKKLPQEFQRKHFTYTDPKHVDPFISGIPNSDYDLLEELMDDDLRKEIGELSSDDESYNAAAQSFLKPTKSSEKRVSVQFNKCVNEPATKPATNNQRLNDCKSTNAMLRSETPKPVSKCGKKIAQMPQESNSLKVQQQAANKIRQGNCVLASTSQCAPTYVSTTSNAQNKAFNNVKTLTKDQMVIEPSIFVSTVPQQAPIQNVLLVGQELAYGGYANVQTPVQSMNRLVSNTYVAVNSTPTMTLYQTTQFTAPVVIGTSITGPVVNNASCAAISVQPHVIDNLTQTSYPAVNVEPQTSVADSETSMKTYDTHTVINNQDCVTDNSKQKYKLQDENKASERKVLSEVQDFVTTENIDKMRNQTTETNINVNIKKDTISDTERLKKKRLAIVNREIYHQCGKKTIPLTYSPLSMKVDTILEKDDFSTPIPLSYTSLISKEDKQKLSDTEEEKLLAQIKTNLQDLSDAINEVSSPPTPDINDSKENKSNSELPCRRILLRSSNKITSKSNAERPVSATPTTKKTKAKLNSEDIDAATEGCDKANQDKTDEKETSAPKRASKRLRSKKNTLITEDKKPLQIQCKKPDKKEKPSSANKTKSKLQKKTESLEYLDIESELQGSKITKLFIENECKLENDRSKSINCEKDCLISADTTKEKNIPEPSVAQKTSFSEPQKTAVPSHNTAVTADKGNKDASPKEAIAQKTSLSEQFSQKTAMPVNTTNVILVDSFAAQKSVENQSVPEFVDDIKIEEKYVPDNITDMKFDDDANVTVHPVNLKTSKKVFSDTNKNTEDDSEGIINKCVNNARANVPNYNEFKQHFTTTNSVDTKLFNTKDSTEFQSNPVPSIKFMTTNDDVKCVAEKCNTSDSQVINEQNKINLPGKDNIDLDMTVTCEEAKPKLSPTFGNILTARSKPINDVKKKDKVCDIVKVNNGIDLRKKYTAENSTPVASLHDIEMPEKTEPCIVNVNVEPTPVSWLVKNTPKIKPEPEVTSSQHTEKPTTTNIAADMNEVVVITDDNKINKPVIPLKQQKKKIEASVEKHANIKAFVLQNNIEASVLNPVSSRINDETSVVKLGKDEASLSQVLSHSNAYKTQTKINAVVNPDLDDKREPSEILQNFKDKIHIEHLSSNDPMTSTVRISLPNGRKVIATVRDKVHVTYDTLFAHPAIRQALLNENNCKRRYVMNVQQIVTVDKSDPNKILSAEINKIETPTPTNVPVKPVETIDLLSEDEDSGPSQITATNKQMFVTEYGKFTAPPMEKELFIKHQNKFSQKPKILLKKVDAKPDTQVEKIDDKSNKQMKKVHEKPDTQVEKIDIELNMPKITENNVLSDITSLIPSQYLTGLINDIDHKIAPEVSIVPIVIPEVVEIDDSSNESFDQGKPVVTITEDKTINELKNVLLKELGVEVRTQLSPNDLQKERSNDDDVELVEEISPSKNCNRRKVVKLSTIPKGKSCPFDDLDEEEQLQITKRKCAIKLVRCDDLLNKYEKDVAGAMTESSAHVMDDEPITIKDFIFNEYDEKIVESEERSSSPVIELFDVLVSLDNKSLAHHSSAVHQVTPLSCDANWHSTKTKLHLQTMENKLIMRSKVFKNETNISDDSLIDQEIPLFCEANWLTTKFTLHLQAVDIGPLQSHDFDGDDDICNDTMSDEAIPPSCEASWATTKPTPHWQNINDVTLVRSHLEYDDEMYHDRSADQVIPVPCNANWHSTKCMLHFQSVNDVTLVQSHVDYGDDMCDDPMIGLAIPLSCQASWFTTKSRLHLQGVNDTALTRYHVFGNDKICNDNKTRIVNPLSCKANWLTTKYMLYLQGLNSELSQSNDIEFDTTSCDSILAHNVIQLSCEAPWFNTKATLHLEAANNGILKRSSISTDGNEKQRNVRTFTSNVPEIIPLQKVHSPSAPSLVSLVLETFRNTNIIHQYRILRRASTRYPINLLKRKSSSLRSSAACKVSKLNVTPEIKFIDSNVAIDTSASVLKNVSGHILQDTKMVSHLQSSSEGKSLQISACAIKCIDNHNLNVLADDEDNVSEKDGSANKDVDATAVDSNITIGSCNENHTSFESSDLKREENYDNIYSPSEYRSPSPVIDTTNLILFEMDTSIECNKQSCQDGQPILPTITEEQLPQQSNSCYKASNPSIEKENLLDIQEDINDCDDISANCTSLEAKRLRNGSLETECSIVSETYEIEPHPDEYSDDYDEIEVKLAEIVGESLINENNTRPSQNNYMDKMSDSQKSDIIKIILGNEPFVKTDSKKNEITVNCDEEKGCYKNSEILVDEYSMAEDHKYYTSPGGLSESIDKISKDNNDVNYISTDDVNFLSENESTKELEEEIVDMRSDEILDDFIHETTTFFDFGESNSSKLSDQLSGPVFLGDIVSAATDENCVSQATIKDDDDIALRKVKENKYQETTEDLIENCVVTAKDSVKMEGNTTKLSNDISAESIMNKYLALIRNKSEVLESVVEYEDPEAGICYVIPIIEESSHSDIESIEKTEVVSSIIESPKITAKKAKTVNVGSSRQNYTLSRSKEVYNYKNGLGDDDIEARLAEIVGEGVSENENKEISTRTIRLDEKYKTSYSVEVEVISSPEKDFENVACRLGGTDDKVSQKTMAKHLRSKSVASKKRRSKYHDKSEDADIENLKVKMPNRTYSKAAEQIRTRRRSLKRKMDMSDNKTSERKYRKGKNIDYPRFTAASLSETVYAKEYKNLIDYCSSVKFSFAVPFLKDDIDVHDTLKSWPIENTEPHKIEQSVEASESLFAEIEKSEALLDPLEQTLPEEIISKFDENSYTPSNIHETNFNMGFGERSGRVIQQELKDGEYTTFSAATLSDVKQLQPLLPSDEKIPLVRTNNVEKKVHDQKLKAMRFVSYMNMREKVRSFFEKTKAELASDWRLNHKKDDLENYSDISSWPFGDLTSTRCIRHSPVEITVNVVQVGQLPVSAAAQNPVTCDPRVTHVSNASPSQCSPGNSLGDELQTPIKTEYTELTTANITLPLMQEYVQHHLTTSAPQESTNLYSANDSTSMSTQILKSVVKIELMDETSQENEDDNVDYENNSLQQLSNGNLSNSVQYQFENIANNVVIESDPILATNSSKTSKTTATFSEEKQRNNTVEKPDQLAHAMNAAGISATKGLAKTNNPVGTIQQNAQLNVTATQANANHFSKATPINAIALQQALAQILPPPLNQTSTSENISQTNQQVLHIVQGNNAQSVINKPNGTQLLHIVQNKSAANTNGTPASQQNTFSGLSLVDGAIQQSGNQLLHIVNTANQKNANAGQLLKRVNLLTNLTNVQGSNEQKMVQFVCKSADGKSIQLPHQRSMVLRLQPLDPTNVPPTPKQNENQDNSSSSGTTHSVNEKESTHQEMKSRSLYEENYAKFVQNDAKFTQNGDLKPALEKATSLPKFNQVFGKQVYQDKQNEMESENLPENSDPPEDNNPHLEQMNDVANPPMLLRKPNATQPSHVQPNLVQQIKQTIGPMNIQTMHGGVIYTRQIPVNIGNGQTINLITVPSTDLVDDSAQKQQTDGKFGNQDGDPPIIKIVPTNQPATTQNGSTDDSNAPIRPTNEANPQPNPQPQPVLTQMRIKLPMLSKAPQMVGGTRVVRPSFFQIQRNVIGGANQQVYQQLVLTAAPPLGQSIRLPAQVTKPKTPSDTQSSPESQMSSSTLEQLREFDMVLEQVKERSTVQPGSSTSSTTNFTKLKSSPDTTDAPAASTSSQDTPTQVLYSVGNTQPLNMVNYVNRKSTITSTTTSSFVRSPESTGTIESPSSSTHSHLPHTVTSDSCASSSCASEAAAATAVQPKPKKKKPKPSTSTSNPFNIKNTPKPSSQKPLEDEQTTQRILYILAEYKEQVENSPDKDKPAPRRRNNPAAPNAGSSKRKKSSSGSRRRDMSPVLGEDSCRTMGSEDSSCGTSLGECNECLETHSPEESPKKVVRRLTFEQETQVTQTRTTTTTTMPQRNVIVTDGQAFAVRGATGKPATTVLMPANYLLPVSMVKGGQQIAIVTNRGPKLLVGAGEAGSGGALLFQRLIGPGGLKPMLARPGVRHIRLPTTTLHNLQAFNIATPAAGNVQPPDSTASPAPAPTPPDLVDTRAMSSPWPDRDAGEVKPERGNSSPEGSEPWNLPSSSIADDYGYEEIVRTDNMDRTVLVVHRKDGRHTTRLTHVSAAALRHKYAILEHELRLQKSLSEECEDLGVDSPSASELFPEAELLFAPSPAHEQTIDQCHTPQPTIHTQGIPQPDLDDQIATDHLLTHKERHDDLDINLDDVGEIVTVGEDGMTTIPLDHEEFARSHEEFARSHPNTTFHSEPEDGEVPPFTIAQGVKGRQITFHSRGVPGTVVMAPQTRVISQATVEATGTQNPVKFTDIDNMINAMPTPQHGHINMPTVLKENNESLTKFDRLLNESRELNLSNTASAIVHSTGNGTQVIRRVQYERRDSRYLVEDDAMIAGESKTDERRDMIDDTSSSERHPELYWDTQSRPDRKRFDFSSDSDKCCKSPYDETNSDSSGIGAHTRLDSVIKAARPERRRSDGSSAEESHPPLRTYPPKRTHQHTHHTHHHDVDRSVTGKTRASERCHDVKDESRRRASNRGVVKRGCHCCNGSTAPKPKKSRPKKINDYPHN